MSSAVARSRVGASNPALSRKSGMSGTMNQTYAEKKAAALSAKNTVVLSYDELERIKSMCSNTNE